MSIKQLSQMAALKITSNQDLNESQVTKIIEEAMLDLMKEIDAASQSAINHCCSADQDMAHKLKEEFNKGQQSLIASLSSLR